MSYDLFFNRIDPLTDEEFTEYFSHLPNYKASNSQAFFQNEDTGVYFSYDLNKAKEPVENQNHFLVSFNLNFYRPHFFALEAAPHLDAFVKHFGFSIFDPQTHGMGEAAFSIDGFLRGWNHGNEFGYMAVLQGEHAPKDIHFRPTAELEAVWRWNFERNKVQNKLGESIFVPKVSWIEREKKLYSVAIWPDGVPTLIPNVDGIIVPRVELAPMKLFKRQKDTCFIAQSTLDAVLEPFDIGTYSLPCRVPTYQVAHGKIKSFVTKLAPQTFIGKGLPMDSVLNSELVTKAINKTNG
jgi:hypothetical protein